MLEKEQVLREGLRYNSGKTKWGLLSWPALRELVAVLEFGARKYAAWNWSNGLSWSECFESMQRHLTAWYTGEDKDPETGLSHMAHVLCNAMFLTHFIIFRTGRDDRPAALNQGDKSIDAERERQEAKLRALEAQFAREGDAGQARLRAAATPLYPMESCRVQELKRTDDV